MKIKSNKTAKVYEVYISHTGENRMPCPECSSERKKQNAKSFSFNTTKGTGHCLHCGASFYEFREPVVKKEYKIPEWRNRTHLSDEAAKYMRGRLILDDVLNSMNISSATEYMPQAEKDQSVICFPYYRNGQLVNIKYRSGNKNFKLCKDAELIFYNLDSLQGQTEAVIVEGEIDCLSMLQAGVKNCVSVPNGAGATSLEYIDNCFEQLALIEKFFIAVDNDTPGFKLREELIRRLGSEKCSIVNFKDCKDANEYLVKYGSFELGDILKSAVDVPVEGVYSCKDFYDEIYDLYLHGFQPGATIGIQPLDELITWNTGRLAIVTGIPGHGKSEIVDYLVVLINFIYGWKTAYYSPENHPTSYHFGKLASKISGKSFDSKYLNHNEFERTYNFINDNFFFISPEDDITIENILAKGKYMVRKHGIKVMVIDPYNKLDHLQERGESETQYISRFLDRLANFARINGVLVFLVAHPRKMSAKKDNPGLFEIPTLYDINGSANFFNKADYGLTVYLNRQDSIVTLHIQKVKFKHWGHTGSVDFKYNSINGRIFLSESDFNTESYLNQANQENMDLQVQPNYEDAPF